MTILLSATQREPRWFFPELEGGMQRHECVSVFPSSLLPPSSSNNHPQHQHNPTMPLDLCLSISIVTVQCFALLQILLTWQRFSVWFLGDRIPAKTLICDCSVSHPVPVPSSPKRRWTSSPNMLIDHLLIRTIQPTSSIFIDALSQGSSLRYSIVSRLHFLLP